MIYNLNLTWFIVPSNSSTNTSYRSDCFAECSGASVTNLVDGSCAQMFKEQLARRVVNEIGTLKLISLAIEIPDICSRCSSCKSKIYNGLFSLTQE